MVRVVVNFFGNLESPHIERITCTRNCRNLSEYRHDVAASDSDFKKKIC